MNAIARNVAIALFTVTAVAACARLAPVYNVNDMPVMANRPSLSADDVGKAIMRAGAGLGWQMQSVKPGLMVGTLQLREHTAVVDVKYNAKSYSINYKNSNNLNYDGQMIHKNYNGWVQNLDKAIKVQLSTL